MKTIEVFHCLLCFFALSSGTSYEPNWKSLDARPLPSWFDEGKIGIFVHFGVFSVPSFVSEWFWCYWKCSDRINPAVVKFMKNNYPPNFTYQDFASELSLEFFNGSEWAELFTKSGVKYAVLTSKHHEGFTMWPSKYSFSWNALDIGPHRDVVKEFSEAVKNKGLHLGLYHSLFEWFHPLYEEDRANNFTTFKYSKGKALPELYELVNNYKPDLIWSDGDAGPDTYWNSQEFLAWLYNSSPVKKTVIVNDRWGDGSSCTHGGYWNCADRYTPGEKLSHKWENAMTLDKISWGYRRNMKSSEVLSSFELLQSLLTTISKGGNLLINVGPTKEGNIPAIFEERLLALGSWLSVNGEGIYNTQPWISFNDSLTGGIYYTASKDTNNIYASFLIWPLNGLLKLKLPRVSKNSNITLLGGTQVCQWKIKDDVLNIALPYNAPHSDAWMIKITDVLNKALN